MNDSYVLDAQAKGPRECPVCLVRLPEWWLVIHIVSNHRHRLVSTTVEIATSGIAQ